MNDFIPVNIPLLNGNEKKYLTECIETSWISSEGPFVKKFEEAMAVQCGRKHGIAVANGSAALDIAVAALELSPGDEVILPSFTIISCAASVVRAGATPVVVDCDPQTWNMRPDQVEAAITTRTQAIMAVHIYGLPVDMDPILDLAQKHGLRVIEDAAEAIGQTYKSRACGGMGDLSTLSFYPNKHVTTGEGGMVLCDDENLAERCRSLRNLCFQKKQRFLHDELGWNYRMSNLQAALGLAQLERLDESVRIKRRMGRRYTEQLTGLDGVTLPLESIDYADNIYWVYGIILADNIAFDAQSAMKRLAEKGVGTRPFFWPMHEQPVFKKMELFQGFSLPVAERIARRGFYLPGGLALTDNEIERVTQAMKEIMA